MLKETLPVMPVFEPWEPAAASDFLMEQEGACRRGVLHTRLGEKHPSFPYLELTGEGSAVSFSLRGLHAQEGVTLEIQEVHRREDRPFACRLWADGKPVYVRTYAPCCDGANHYFVQLGQRPAGEPVRLKIENIGDSPVRLLRVYGYPDALRLAESQGLGAPMRLGLFTPGLSGDEEEDLRRLKEAQERYAPYPVLFGWDIYYIRLSRQELHDRLDYLLHLAHRAQVPVALDLNSWWNGTPAGMDGLGGTWRDLPYQQVLYDPQDVTGFGRYQLTTPNYWKNMPWLTMNNPHYNAARAARLTDAAQHLKRRIAQYRAQGLTAPEVILFTENEPDYWHYGAWHDSADSVPGMEPCAVEAAAAQGVRLDPVFGMEDRQRDWLWKNLTDYIVGVGEAIRAGAGPDAVAVSGGAFRLPEDQLLEHSYTHGALNPGNQPFPDERHALWETHLIGSLRLGYQGGPTAEDPREMDYATCYGRLAGVNKEQLRESTFSLLPYAYLYGADFQMIFNYRHCEDKLVMAPKPEEYETEPVPVLSYERQLWEYSFDTPRCLETGERLMKAEGLCLTTARGSRAAGVGEKAREGCLTFHIHSDGGFPNGLVTVLNATIQAGTSDWLELGYEAGQPVLRQELPGRHQYVAGYRTDWSDRLDRQARDLYLTIHIPGSCSEAEYRVPGKNSLCRLSVLLPYPEPSGHTDGFAYTFGQLRLLYRLSERREDARRLLAACREPELAKRLQPLFDGGAYQEVYDSLLRAGSQTLPASYFVQDEGPLGSRPLWVSTDAPVWITLLEAGEKNCRLCAETVDGRPARLRIAWKGRRFEGREENGCLVLTADGEGAQAYEWTVLPGEKSLPPVLKGRFLRTQAQQVWLQSQDTAVTFYADAVPLPLAVGCRCLLRTEGEEGPYAAAALQELTPAMAVTLHTDGKAVVEIQALAGRIEGTVTAVTEAGIVGQARQPWLTVTDGTRQVTAEIGPECRLAFEGATGAGLLVSRIGCLGLKAGQRVCLTYLPEAAFGHCRALEITDGQRPQAGA